MSNRIRIRAVQQESNIKPGLHYTLKGRDVALYLVADDGTETLIDGVFNVTWIADGPGACRAVITAQAELTVDMSPDQVATDPVFDQAVRDASKGDT